MSLGLAVGVSLFAFLFVMALFSIGNRLGEIRDELRITREAEARRWKADKEFYK